MLTWSLGCTGVCVPSVPPASWMARLAMTSLTFMFDWVPDPVCQTNSGNSGVVLAGDDLVRRAVDELGLVLREPAQLGVHPGRGLLHDAVSPVHRLGHPVVADGEVVERALGLRAPAAARSGRGPAPSSRSRSGTSRPPPACPPSLPSFRAPSVRPPRSPGPSYDIGAWALEERTVGRSPEAGGDRRPDRVLGGGGRHARVLRLPGDGEGDVRGELEQLVQRGEQRSGRIPSGLETVRRAPGPRRASSRRSPAVPRRSGPPAPLRGRCRRCCTGRCGG